MATGVKKSDAETLLGTGAGTSAFREIRIRDEMRRLERERDKVRRQVDAAQKASADIKEAIAAIRSAANIFDRFYRDYDPDRLRAQKVRDIWLKERSWEDRKFRQKSTRLQGDVRSALQSLKNAQGRLENISFELPDDVAEKASLKACADSAKALLRGLQAYESGIQRNAVEKYESSRGTAMELAIDGC